MVEHSSNKLKGRGSNPGYGGLILTQLLKPGPIDKMSPWWRSGRAFTCHTDGPGFEPGRGQLYITRVWRWTTKNKLQKNVEARVSQQPLFF